VKCPEKAGHRFHRKRLRFLSYAARGGKGRGRKEDVQVLELNRRGVWSAEERGNLVVNCHHENFRAQKGHRRVDRQCE